LQIQLLQNDRANNRYVHNELTALINPKRFDTIEIAVSYVMNSGVGMLLPRLKSFLKEGGQIKLLFGDDFELSESAALQKLFDSKVEIRLFVGNMNYHPKIWIFKGPSSAVVVVGSSNLSQPALVTNIEANVLIEDKEFAGILGESFQILWNEFGREIDQEWIDHYHDREEVAKSEPRYTREGKPDFDSNLKQVDVFIKSWWKYIKKPRKMRQSEYWRGWYIAPEPAIFDDSRLTALQNVLTAILDSDEYANRGRVTITRKFANEVLAKANFQFEGRPMTQSAEGRRDLFIRQPKNKLEKLGFLVELDSNGPVVQVTDLGRQFTGASTRSERKHIYSKASHNFRWAWAPKLDMVDFTTRLLKSVPTNRLQFHEFSYIIIHVFHPKMYGSTKRLVTMFKQLPDDVRNGLISRTDRALEKELERMGKGAFRHYQNKVFELMSSFGYVEGIKFHGVKESPLSCYLELA